MEDYLTKEEIVDFSSYKKRILDGSAKPFKDKVDNYCKGRYSDYNQCNYW